MRALVALALLAAVRSSVIPRQESEDCDMGNARACEVVRSLARQLIAQQLYVEERTRSEGDSGIKQVRSERYSTLPYFSETHTGRGVMSIHEHANNERVVGMGEFSAVLNGIEFRTRHNDYMMVRPSTTSNEYHATEDIDYPPVPPSVTAQANVQDQITEMKEYFRAWAEQDTSIRDYKPYFKPVISYMEGAWTVPTGDLDESFDSDRHHLDADSWEDLENKIIFTSASGIKDIEENYAYLPKKVVSLDDTYDTYPKFGQWNYRILCHPLDDDLPVNRFRVVDDLTVRMARDIKHEDLAKYRQARFQLNPRDTKKFRDGTYNYGLLDEFMGQIPGKENYLGELRDDAFDLDIVNVKTGRPLNAAFYHRQYKVNRKDASGRQQNSRGFSDENLFVALTEKEQIVAQKAEKCEKSKNSVEPNCQSYSQKWSYAIPLEIIYMTPLTKWNPYNLKMQANDKIPRADNRDGSLDKPLDGISRRIYFQTPAEFFNNEDMEADDADTSQDVVYVQDPDGTARAVRASGHRITLPNIEGVGSLRQRYPIAPVHNEGNSIMKELSALKELVLHPVTYKDILKEKVEYENGGDDNEEEEEEELPLIAYFETPLSDVAHGNHKHRIELHRWQLKKLINGKNVWVTTEKADGHTHYLKIQATKVGEEYVAYMTRCDEKPMPCWDGHDGNGGQLTRIDN